MLTHLLVGSKIYFQLCEASQLLDFQTCRNLHESQLYKTKTLEFILLFYPISCYEIPNYLYNYSSFFVTNLHQCREVNHQRKLSWNIVPVSHLISVKSSETIPKMALFGLWNKTICQYNIFVSTKRH
jgi:hypothetical protein